jgi:hypothetical protein
VLAAAPDRVAAYGLENHAGTPVYVHAKVCVVDDVWTTVGSDNFNRRSWTHDSELSAVVVDHDYSLDLRLTLAAEHLDRLEDVATGDLHEVMADCVDPRGMFDAYAASAARLEEWHAGGGVGERPPGRLRHLPVPDLPPREKCVASTDAPAEIKRIAPLIDRFGTLLDPETAMWAIGRPSRKGVIQGWFKLADDRPLDPLALLMVVDALPPTTFDLGMPGWAPTLELTAHVRAKPAPGWAVVRHATRTVAGGLFEEDCDVWDSTGRLVAQSRQLALQPRG